MPDNRFDNSGRLANNHKACAQNGSSCLAQSFAGRRRKMAITLLALAALGVAASGCGRRGDPELPEAAVIPGQEAAPATDAPVKEDRPFILDSLIK